MLVRLVNTLVRAGSREKCHFQWLSEQGHRCWRTDCFWKLPDICEEEKQDMTKDIFFQITINVKGHSVNLN